MASRIGVIFAKNRESQPLNPNIRIQSSVLRFRLGPEPQLHGALACRKNRGSAGQDLFQRRLNSVDFFADDSNRLLISRGVGEGIDGFQSAPYLMISRPNEVETRPSLLTISVNSADELGGEPGKYQAKQQFDRNSVGYAVKL